MNEVKEAVRNITEAFSQINFPAAFLEKYEQLECLACHTGQDTFLVHEKAGERLMVAKCYDKTFYPGLQETAILQTLRHRGLPVFVDEFHNETMLCIVREYIQGVPLSQYAAQNELSREQITAFCIQLSDLLIFLHEQKPPVIHRDIKPQNIIVRQDGEISLIDFDTARTFKVDAETDTQFFGTKGYAPPEQYGFTQTDCRADIYSFGVLLRFLLTDSTRDNPNVRLYKPLAKIIAKCTAFAPKDRYQDMRYVKRALLAANPKSQFMRKAAIFFSTLAACALLTYSGVTLYQYLTFDPFADGHIPAVMQDEERVEDAVAYLQKKYGTHLFDDTNSYMTIGLLKDALVEMYGMEYDYAHIPSPLDPPRENPDAFLPWSMGDEQYVDKEYMAYFATKIYWPEIVTDWSKLKDDTGEYPGVRVSLIWCDDHGILTGVKRPKDITRGEAATLLANADRVSEALDE